MSEDLTKTVLESIQSAAKKLTGWKRREFQAESALKFCDGNSRKAEQIFGWGRAAVQTGLMELETGIRCIDAVQSRGRKKAEVKDPQLAEAIRKLAEPETQADPKFQSPLAFTRITGKAVREELMRTSQVEDIPAERSLHRILNRMGYCTRRVRKTKPQKNPRNGRHL